jgi:hypothetical protein
MRTDDLVVVVSCGKGKAWDRTPDAGPLAARDAYSSPAFRASRRYAEHFGTHGWWILSAKYGLIEPTFVIPQNYNVKFGDADAVSIARLRDQIAKARWSDAGAVAVLGSLAYFRALQQAVEGSGVTLRHVNGNVSYPPVFLPLVTELIETNKAFPASTPTRPALPASPRRHWSQPPVGVSTTCAALHELVRTGTRHRFPFDARQLPRNGLYVLFEAGEHGHGGDRIVRIGTHRGDGELPSRMQQHFIKGNKDRSIFRKHIGRALLQQASDPYVTEWDRDRTSRAARRLYGDEPTQSARQRVERAVTEYLQERFSFVVLSVDDERDRGALEAKMISTVSWCTQCQSSPTWLGLQSPKTRIRESGLWLINELYKEPLSAEEVEPLLARLR